MAWAGLALSAAVGGEPSGRLEPCIELAVRARYCSLQGASLFLTNPIDAKSAQPPGVWFDVGRNAGAPAVVFEGLPPAWHVAVVGQHAVLVDYTRWLHVYDMEKRPWREVAKLLLPGQGENIVVRGRQAYIANHTSGLTIVDLADPEKPRILGNFNPKIDCDAVGLWADCAILYGHWESRLVLVDVSDPERLRQVGVYQHDPKTFIQGQIAVDRGFAWCSTNRGLLVVDVRTPTEPKRAAFLDFRGKATDVALSGDYAFAACGEQGVRVLDARRPESPREVAAYHRADLDAQQLKARTVPATAATGDESYLYVANAKGPALVLRFRADREPNPVPVLGGSWPGEWHEVAADMQTAQRAAGAKLHSDVAAALRCGDRLFQIPPGTYRVDETFEFLGTKDFMFDGQGARILFDSESAMAGGFVLRDCRNVTIKNLNVEWTRIGFLQGKIVEVDRADDSVLYKPGEGYGHIYPEHRSGKIALHNGGDGAEGVWRLFVFNAQGEFAPYQVRMGALPVEPDSRPFLRSDAQGRYRFKVSGPNNPQHVYTPEQKGVSVGATVTASCRGGANLFTLNDCGPVTIENVTCHSTPYRVVNCHGGEGPLTLRNVQNVRWPGTNRMLSAGCDGFLIGMMRHGPTIENCQLDGLADDFVNVYSLLLPVYAQVSPTELLVAIFPLNGDPTPVLHFVTYGTWRFLDDCKVKSVSAAQQYTLPDGWSRGWTMPKRWRGTGFTAGDKVQVLRVVLEKPLSIPPEGVAFSSESCVNAGTVVRGCNFRHGAVRGMLLQFNDGLIEDNTIHNMLESALLLQCEPSYWGSAITPRNIVIRGNTLTDTNGRSISHVYSGAIQMGVEGDSKLAEWVRNVTIENNRILRPGGSAIAINGARNVKIIGNRFEQCGNLPWHGKGRQPEKYGIPVAVYAGEGIEQKDNQALHTGLYSLDQ